MTAQILDGVATAAAIKDELTERVAALKAKGITPGLGTLLVGDDPGSHLVRRRQAPGLRRGRHRVDPRRPAGRTPRRKMCGQVRELNEDPECTGYIVQLPLPKHIDENAILELIDPAKDADGLHPTNLGRLVLNVNRPMTSPLPCTPAARRAAAAPRHRPHGKHVVVVGRGVTVGRPIGLLLTRRDINATVTLTHTGTEDLAAELRHADVVIAAAGVRAPHQGRRT